jgi:hypothetical protein
VIPGNSNQRFLLQENEDGSILLQPASVVTDAQLEYDGDAVLDACELIFRLPAQAQTRSTAITTAEGIRFRLPVAGHPPYKVFWSSDGPRIEAVFPHP